MNHTVDLLPTEYSAAKAVGKRLGLWIAVNGLAILLALTASLGLRWKATELRSSVERLRSQVSEGQGWAEKVAPLSGKLQEGLERQKVANRLLNEPCWSGLFSDLAGAVGKKVWLNHLDLRKEAARPEEEGKPERSVTEIRISGASTSNAEVIAFINNLSESKRLSELELEISRMPRVSEESVMVEFRVLGVVR
ncbi:MAG TPA: PilN domain-containing protein [Sumerlaeia bacterium]|nr:PilN domain-containing protein [Sumerlaeia bacterium]